MASDIFAKIGDIKGESLDAKHKDEIEVLSFSWGVTNSANIKAGGGGGAGKATFHRSFLPSQHRQGVSESAEGVRDRRAPEGSHHHASQGGQRPAGIPHHQDERRHHHRRRAGDSGGVAGSETVSLAFAKVDLEYKPQKADGSLDAGIHFKYDIKANKVG